MGNLFFLFVNALFLKVITGSAKLDTAKPPDGNAWVVERAYNGFDDIQINQRRTKVEQRQDEAGSDTQEEEAE